MRTIVSKCVPLLDPNVDTDQVTPASALFSTTRKNYAEDLFRHWRYAAGGAPRPDFVLNRPEMRGRSILLAGDNFGCGSSRECAPWALVDWGFRAVVATSIADIFRNNALKNALVPVVVSPTFHRVLVARPEADVTIDLQDCTLSLPEGGAEKFQIDPFSRFCLLNEVEELECLLARDEDVAAFEAENKE